MAYLHPNAAALHYRVQGEGPPVLALHGTASTGAQWRSLVGYLEGRFQVFTPDLPGYGGSAAGAGGLAADAEAIAGLLDRIGAPVHLIGHSYGGAVALKLATLWPAALRSLTLIEPTAFHLLRHGSVQDRALYAEFAELGAAIGRAAEARQPALAMRRFIDYWNGEGAWARSSPRLRSYFLGCLERVRADFGAVAAEAGGPSDLAGIDCPALAVMGLESPAPSLRATEAVAEALPRAELRMIPDAGHLAPLTDPHLVDPMIAAHLLAADRASLRARAA